MEMVRPAYTSSHHVSLSRNEISLIQLIHLQTLNAEEMILERIGIVRNEIRASGGTARSTVDSASPIPAEPSVSERPRISYVMSKTILLDLKCDPIEEH
jgi:hypothetical protein